MKLKTKCLIFALLVTCMTGCSNKNDSISEKETGSILETSEKETSSISELSVSVEHAKEVLNSFSNFKASDQLSLNIPEHTAEVCQYTSVVPSSVDMKKYYDEYMAMFEYLFPDHTLDENYLLYIGGSSDLVYDEDGNVVQDFNKVKDWYDEILSGEEGMVAFLYDETWYLDMTEWKAPVSLELGNPIGYGYAVINKGKTVELSDYKVYDESLQAERYPCLNSFDVEENLEYVKTCSPDSTESFKLADKEVPINEAVDFFETYINELPYPEDKNMRTVVIEVAVYKVTEDIYGYNFYTTAEYKGVTFDHKKEGSYQSSSTYDNYSTIGGTAFMVESDEVDIVYSYYQHESCENEIVVKNVVSFEEAAKIFSEEMTDLVEFEVQQIELVYTQKYAKTEEGYIDIENLRSEVAPAWKFTLCNPNDDMVYICYIDAIDGQNFRFYTTSSSEFYKTSGNQEQES